MVADDTINQDFALLEKMVIRNGAEITINDDNIYTISDTTVLEGTGFITGDGYISLSGNGIIATNRWDKSLFKGRADNHPKLIWSKYPSDTITVSSYKVYGKYGSAAWQLLAALDDTILSYTDNNVNINQPGGPAGSVAQYKVTAYYNRSETDPSNTISYDITNGDIEKGKSSQTAVLEYKLDQNYPNPFNPVSIINYSIKDNCHVKLVIYDILGRELLTLVNENKIAGKYSSEFNASSLPSEVYIYKLTTKNYSQARKMLLVK